MQGHIGTDTVSRLAEARQSSTAGRAQGEITPFVYKKTPVPGSVPSHCCAQLPLTGYATVCSIALLQLNAVWASQWTRVVTGVT